MKSATLNETVSDEGARRSLESQLNELLSTLDVTYRLTLDTYPRIELRGEDEEAAHSYLSSQLETVPDELEKGIRFTGRLVDPGDVGFGIFAAIGNRDILIPLWALRALGDGSVNEIADQYGLVDGLPVQLTIEETGDKPEAIFTESEIRLLTERRKAGALIAIGCTRSRFKRALKHSGASQHVEKVEKLGLSEHVAITDDETDPAGLIPKVGPYLAGVTLHPVG